MNITDTTYDSQLNYYISKAKKSIKHVRYPFNNAPIAWDAETDYTEKIIELVIYDYSKMGVEGQTSHSENGIGRGYEDAAYPKSMLNEIVPVVGVS